VYHLSGAPLWGRLLALPAKITLGWKKQPGPNSKDYYERTVIKSFITLDPGTSTIKLFSAIANTIVS
jgi:hypothetical protein